MTYLWHCHLGHINEKHISKLHKDGFLDSFNFESIEICKSCLLGKMTKDPFTGHSERAIDLLGLIHTDVCSPLSVAAEEVISTSSHLLMISVDMDMSF